MQLDSSIDTSSTVSRVTFLAYQRVGVGDVYHVDGNEAEVLVLFPAEGL